MLALASHLLSESIKLASISISTSISHSILSILIHLQPLMLSELAFCLLAGYLQALSWTANKEYVCVSSLSVRPSAGG